MTCNQYGEIILPVSPARDATGDPTPSASVAEVDQLAIDIPALAKAVAVEVVRLLDKQVADASAAEREMFLSVARKFAAEQAEKQRQGGYVKPDSDYFR
jgi:hypothetical protein